MVEGFGFGLDIFSLKFAACRMGKLCCGGRLPANGGGSFHSRGFLSRGFRV